MKKKKFIILMIILFFMVIEFIFIINFSSDDAILYIDNNNANYKVYLNNGDIYSSNNKNGAFNGKSIDRIKIDFNYITTYKERASYNGNYYLKSRFKILNDEDKVLYTKEENLTEKKSIDNVDEIISTSINYKEYLSNYKKKMEKYNGIALVDIVMCIDTNGVTKDVSAVTIPLTDNLIVINYNAMGNFINNRAGNFNYFYFAFLIVGIVCILINLNPKEEDIEILDVFSPVQLSFMDVFGDLNEKTIDTEEELEII